MYTLASLLSKGRAVTSQDARAKSKRQQKTDAHRKAARQARRKQRR